MCVGVLLPVLLLFSIPAQAETRNGLLHKAESALCVQGAVAVAFSNISDDNLRAIAFEEGVVRHFCWRKD